MKKIINLSLILSFILIAPSCAVLEGIFEKPRADISSLNNGTRMNYKKFFDGNLKGFAITKNEYGEIIGTKTIKVTGEWEVNKGIIKFSYKDDNNKRDSRTWLVTLNSDNTINAVGHDITSPAKGKQTGNAAQLSYALNVNHPQGGKEEVKYYESMYLANSNSMIMIQEFYKASGSGKNIISLIKEKSTPKAKPKVEVTKE